MFDTLTARLSQTLRNIRGLGRLTEENIKNTLREVRVALLEADVALSVVRDFINHVKIRATGHEVNKSLTPGQEFFKLVKNELVIMMGSKDKTLNLSVQPPAVILVAGLQGSGKTTTVIKLGKFLREKQKKKVLTVSTDIYRPAAIKQLETLAKNIGIDFFPSDLTQKPLQIVKKAKQYAKLQFYDILLVDTAGRLHIDQEMMVEIKQIHSEINPVETLFIADAMSGQDTAKTAKAFNEVLPLTGIILTKVDGDARGGAALSIVWITGKPIKFIGTGEKNDALEVFYPERIASRILGMGDMLSLIEEIEHNVDQIQAKKLTSKLKQGGIFNLNDFLEQIKQMRNVGDISSIMSKIPGMMQLTEKIQPQLNPNILGRTEGIINSMTFKERQNPDIIKGSRKRRIAIGSGMQVQDVNRLLKQFFEMQRMIKKINKSGISKAIRNMKSIMPKLTQ